MGGYTKKKAQTIIQTWHASGALKNFGLTHQVDLNNVTMVGAISTRVSSDLLLYCKVGTCFRRILKINFATRFYHVYHNI